jgi:hypothetical protein
VLNFKLASVLLIDFAMQHVDLSLHSRNIGNCQMNSSSQLLLRTVQPLEMHCTDLVDVRLLLFKVCWCAPATYRDQFAYACTARTLTVYALLYALYD